MERKVELLKSSFSLTMVKILSQFSNYPNSAIYSTSFPLTKLHPLGLSDHHDDLGPLHRVLAAPALDILSEHAYGHAFLIEHVVPSSSSTAWFSPYTSPV